MKKCTKCKIEKELSEFYSRGKSRPGQYFSKCKQCVDKTHVIWEQNNKQLRNKYSREWRKANPDKQKQSTKKWIDSHYQQYRDSCNARNRKNRFYIYKKVLMWRQANPLKCSEYTKKWQKKNPRKLLEYVRHRQMIKIKATPKWVDREKIKNIYLNCPVGYEVDHIIPLRGKTVSGLHVPWNLQYLSPKENRIKGNRICPQK